MVKQWTQILACKTQVLRGKTWTRESHPCLFDWVGEYLLTWVLGLTQKVDFNSCSQISKESRCQVAKVEDHWWILYPNFVWRLSNNNFNTGRKKANRRKCSFMCTQHSGYGMNCVPCLFETLMSALVWFMLILTNGLRNMLREEFPHLITTPFKRGKALTPLPVQILPFFYPNPSSFTSSSTVHRYGSNPQWDHIHRKVTNLGDVNLLGWAKERVRRPSYYLKGNKSLKGW